MFFKMVNLDQSPSQVIEDRVTEGDWDEPHAPCSCPRWVPTISAHLILIPSLFTQFITITPDSLLSFTRVSVVICVPTHWCATAGYCFSFWPSWTSHTTQHPDFSLNFLNITLLLALTVNVSTDHKLLSLCFVRIWHWILCFLFFLSHSLEMHLKNGTWGSLSTLLQTCSKGNRLKSQISSSLKAVGKLLIFQ